jgi:hypothetical protein
LAHYQRTRHRLAEDLGTDPGAALQRLHQRLLAADPALGDTAAVVSARPVVPRQLPAPPPLFTGRASELGLLTAALDDRAERGRSGLVSVIGGMGGMGKSWLARQWAHEHADRFPDGQLWVDLRGFGTADEPMSPSTALRGILEVLGVASAAIPHGLDAQSGLYRSLVVDKRMLIVLDNARDTAQLLPLLPGGTTCAVLVTSRHELADLIIAHGAHWLELDVLPERDARRLLAGRLGSQRLTAEPEAVADLLAYCEGLPLALTITAARAIVYPRRPLAALAAELREESRRLDAMDAGEAGTNLRVVLSWSHRILSDDAARAFALLGSAPSPDVTLSAAVGLFGRPVSATHGLLCQLVRAHLLRRQDGDLYHMHDLVRLYAREQVADPNGSPRRRHSRRGEPGGRVSR